MGYQTKGKIEHFEDKILRQVRDSITAAHGKTVGIVVPAVESKTPVRSGKLKKSVGGESDEKAARIYAGDEDAWYARIIEYRRHPYMRPGILESRGAVDKAFLSELRKAAME